MPKYKKETEKYHMERVQKVLTLRPRASARFIQQALEVDTEAPLRLDIEYILRIKKKIAGERIHRFDQALVEQEVAELEELSQAVNNEMFKILLGLNTTASEKIAAARTIHEIGVRLVEIKMNAGIFERKLGTVNVHHTHELAPEQKTLILQALANYGLIKQNPTQNELPARNAAHIPASPRPDQQPRAA